MRFRFASLLAASLCSVVALFLIYGDLLFPAHGTVHAGTAAAAAKIVVDYPLDRSIFPPDITAPTFLWRDPNSAATRWAIEIHFAHSSEVIRTESAGELMHLGEIDPDAGPSIDLTPEQKLTHTWQPDEATWAKIKKLSVDGPATVTITGLAAKGAEAPLSQGSVSITTSIDPVGAPIFYRDVPLMRPSPEEKGPIAPLPKSALPLINWQIRDISKPSSHVVMHKLPTCANCHSFSADGKTLGLDMDGPRNDKGLYALVPVSKEITIRSQDLLKWSSFQVDPSATTVDSVVKRFGFMSQVSPDGQYVVTSIGPPNNGAKNQGEVPGFAPGILDRLYSINFRDTAFTQVFYPTRGILAWYDRRNHTMRPLPGADDPDYVQTSAFWSPDGKYLIFSRAKAREPFPPGRPKALYANDPNETQIQYDLYKIPFNGGKGGKAEPVKGASNNGMSNDFPKVSPDGKWIVFVENKNGLLMRPDSKLYMVPFAGGKARLMNCNLWRMNSWHTFSPNGRWLAFSSKARSPFTQLMLTHIDANGNDSPAILVENTTAANRAVNIPEFINIAPDGLDHIDPQATEFYRLFDEAFADVEKNQIPAAIETLNKAMAIDPSDPLVHYDLATVLSGTGRESEALIEFRKASDLEPGNTMFLEHLAVSMVLNGDYDGAVAKLHKAVEIAPESAEIRYNLGYVLESHGDFPASIDAFQKAVELTKGQNWRFLAELAKVYDKSGKNTEAIQAAQQALQLAVASHDEKLEQDLRTALDSYRQESAPATAQ